MPRNRMLVLVALMFFAGGCQRGRDGSDGANGKNGAQGDTGGIGLPGLPGGDSGTVPFTFEGTLVFPTATKVQVIPGFSIESGDIVNVYLRWHSGPRVWSQIGSTWVGGMAGSYSIVDDVVTVTVVTGVDTDYVINGITHD